LLGNPKRYTILPTQFCGNLKGAEMKKHWIRAATIMIALMLTGCDSDDSEETAEETVQLRKKQEIKQKVQQLCSRHNAVADWKESRVKYTVEMEEVLVGTDGRPVLLFASVQDIVRESEKYTLYLRGGMLRRKP
jgi:hypothetical protein